MPKAVGVSLRTGGQVLYYDPEGFNLVPGDDVIVPAARGVGYGKVVTPVREIPEEDRNVPLKKVMRRATPQDRERLKANDRRKEKAYKVARELINRHGLPMKLVDVDYIFDGSSIVFYFTSEGRVDFRELVKDLASRLKSRIELRQVGVRDEAKMVGGLGPCGRDLCCSLFLSDFEPVSIKMAKEQDLPLNPSKISGICGRLMCCLKYEVGVYEEFNRSAPAVGSFVERDGERMRVIGYQVPLSRVVLETEEGRKLEVDLSELGRPRKEHRGRKGRRKK